MPPGKRPRSGQARLRFPRAPRPAPHLLLLLALTAAPGCHHWVAPQTTPPPIMATDLAPPDAVPKELAKVSLPSYVIEPPDILLIDAVKIVPRPPHLIDVFDVLAIRVLGTLIDQPIFGTYAVDPEGRVDLGPAYGSVSVVGLSVEEAQGAIERHLRQILEEPQVSVSLVATLGAQRIAGQHLVSPDGTVNLGTYGSVYVAGLTLAQARQAIEQQLAEFLQDPQVMVDVFAYNSKVFYIITEGAGFGDNVIRLPITGNETVLDAIASIGGLSQISSKKLWISRPSPDGIACEQMLPIDWVEITRGASTQTNYQLLPGDRLFIAEDRLVAIDSIVARVTRPFERMIGFTLLGTQAITQLNNLPRGQFRQR